MGVDVSLGRLVETACCLEAKARKPGNVHPGASFVDMTYDDFVRSAQAIAPVFNQAPELSVGQLVLKSVVATRSVLGKNTNLGIILVLAPLAKASQPEQGDVEAVLTALTQQDAEDVYEAIRIAAPSGLGEAPEQDVHRRPTVPLRDAMRLAATRDLIARQYTTGFDDLFNVLLPTLEQGLGQGWPLEQAIVYTHLVSLGKLGDTLIQRKCGPVIAAKAKSRALLVLDADWPESATGLELLQSLDRWLRADGHHRNPGTSADLLAGVLFLALRRGSIEVDPPHWDCPVL